MDCARNSFWSPTGDYISFGNRAYAEAKRRGTLDCEKDLCKHSTFQPDRWFASGNNNIATDQLCDEMSYWQDGETKKIYVPTCGYQRFPCKSTNPNLCFPHEFNIRVPRSSYWIDKPEPPCSRLRN